MIQESVAYHWSTDLVYIRYMCLASAAVVDLNVNANADERAWGMRGEQMRSCRRC
jgi:hypothetical protein